LNLILAVDMPFLQPAFLRYLVAQARDHTAAVVVPAVGKCLQPLCAVYRREFAEAAERSLAADNNGIERLFAEVQTRVVEQEEWERYGFSEEMFRNLNTAVDWQEAMQRLSAATTRGYAQTGPIPPDQRLWPTGSKYEVAHKGELPETTGDAL
jgi:molybdopterin-guanine dinucleotide biosynthesis protein A